MKELDSVALQLVNKALGLAGGGAQTTELEDGLVQQVLEVSHLIGRGRAPITDAIKWCVLETVHGAADDQVAAVDPYFTNSTPGSSPNWPVPVPAGFDVWFFGATGRALSGNLDDGYLGMVGDMSGEKGDMGFSQNQAGGAATNAAIRYPLQAWNNTTGLAGITFLRVLADSSATAGAYRPVRIPRGSTIELRLLSQGAAVLQAYILMGIFPVGLGQDATG